MSNRLIETARAWWPARQRLLPRERGEQALARARIERHGGLTVLYLGGSPYEMGYQHGVLARDLIHGFRRAAYAYVTRQLPVPQAMARPALFYYTGAYWPTVPPEFVEEMQGIAHGAGVHPIEVLVSTAIWEIFLVSGCSEFAALAPLTPDGSLIHGYNYDLMHPDHALIQPYLAVLCYRPEQGIPFFTVNTVGSVGANAGMNEAGISVAWDNTNLRDDALTRGIRLPVVPFIITLRRLLQYASTLDEAVRMVTETLPRPLGDVVVIGSAREGRAVALETAGRTFAVRELEDSAVWSTNCFRSPQLAPFDRLGDGQSLPEKEAREHFPRHYAYAELLATHRGRLTPAAAASFLRDPYPRESQGYLFPNQAPRATICRDITSWSLVMEPGKGRFWVSDTRIPAAQAKFFAFDLASSQRLPELDMEPSGYDEALQAADHYLQGDLAGASEHLDAAFALDGPSAPLTLMRALLLGLQAQEEVAGAVLREVMVSWPATFAASLAASWLGAAETTPLLQPPASSSLSGRLPLPSALRPLLYLRPGASWEERAVPST